MRQRTWRDGWMPLRVGDDGGRLLQPEQMQRTSPSKTASQRDAAALARDGWQVASVVDGVPSGAIAAAVARCWCRLRGRPAPNVVVTYKRLH